MFRRNPPARTIQSNQQRIYLLFALSIPAFLAITLTFLHQREHKPEPSTPSAAPNTGTSLAIEADPFTELLPLGDGKVVTDGPKKGYVYSCTDNFRQGRGSHAGDWIEGAVWDPTKKIHVQGEVHWPAAHVSITTAGDERIISSNDLPEHHTGIFPIARSDPAYAIDRNPNAIAEQNIRYRLPISPTEAASPHCTTRGAVGVMTNGVLLFNALDDAGLDAAAHEVQDTCDGHPQGQDAYHYHRFSPCFASSSARDVIGYALDGFGITGPKKDDGSYYTTADLDECHGTTSRIMWDGEEREMYHYVMTADFPYSVGCFAGTPVSGRLSAR
ncbi:MAG: YHYH protein [Dehalococcoidia bacterium]